MAQEVGSATLPTPEVDSSDEFAPMKPKKEYPV